MTLDEAGAVTTTMQRLSYDVAGMATAIREADGLPDAFARDIETGGSA